MQKTIIWTVLITAFFVIGVYLVYKLSGEGGKSNIAIYKVSDKDRPRLFYQKKFKDIGKMKLQDTKSASFIFENKGNKDLNVFDISSTCMCTFGQIIYKGEKSERFAMHANSNYLLTLKPKEKATLVITYQPSLMPVQGTVERAVVIHTNDPEHPEEYFGIRAFVE